MNLLKIGEMDGRFNMKDKTIITAIIILLVLVALARNCGREESCAHPSDVEVNVVR